MTVSMEDVKPVEIPYLKGARRWILSVGENVAISLSENTGESPHPVVKHDFEEIIYLLKGEMTLEYPELGKKWIMKPGSSKAHPIGTAHTGKVLRGPTMVIEVTSPPADWVMTYLGKEPKYKTHVVHK